MQLKRKNTNTSKTPIMNQVTLTTSEQPDTQTKTTERTCQGQVTTKEPIRR